MLTSALLCVQQQERFIHGFWSYCQRLLLVPPLVSTSWWNNMHMKHGEGCHSQDARILLGRGSMLRKAEILGVEVQTCVGMLFHPLSWFLYIELSYLCALRKHCGNNSFCEFLRWAMGQTVFGVYLFFVSQSLLCIAYCSDWVSSFFFCFWSYSLVAYLQKCRSELCKAQTPGVDYSLQCKCFGLLIMRMLMLLLLETVC